MNNRSILNIIFLILSASFIISAQVDANRLKIYKADLKSKKIYPPGKFSYTYPHFQTHLDSLELFLYKNFNKLSGKAKLSLTVSPFGVLLFSDFIAYSIENKKYSKQITDYIHRKWKYPFSEKDNKTFIIEYEFDFDNMAESANEDRKSAKKSKAVFIIIISVIALIPVVIIATRNN